MNYYTGAMSETGARGPESQNLFCTALLPMLTNIARDG